VLRTTFIVIDGSPMQVISEQGITSLPVIDLSETPEPQREARVRQIAREEAARPFDLERGPMLRAFLLLFA